MSFFLLRTRIRFFTEYKLILRLSENIEEPNFYGHVSKTAGEKNIKNDSKLKYLSIKLSVKYPYPRIKRTSVNAHFVL